MAASLGTARRGMQCRRRRPAAVHPAAIFDRVVPFLLALAALALLFQPQVSAWLTGHDTRSRRLLLPIGLSAASAYDGYWGASVQAYH